MKLICSKCGYTGEGPAFPHPMNIDGRDCRYVARRAPEFTTIAAPVAPRAGEEVVREAFERIYPNDTPLVKKALESTTIVWSPERIAAMNTWAIFGQGYRAALATPPAPAKGDT